MCAPYFALLARVTTRGQATRTPAIHLLLLELGEVHEWETTRCGAKSKGDWGDTSLPTTRDPRKVTCQRCLAKHRQDPGLLCVVT